MTLSIRQRLIYSSLPLISLVLVFAGIGLDRAYQTYASDQEMQKLQLQLWSLMADAEVESAQLVLPEVLQEPEFSRPESTLMGFVIDPQGSVIWQSQSVALAELNITDYQSWLVVNRSGDMTKLRLENEQFLLRQGVSYVDESNGRHSLTFVVLEKGDAYRNQLASYRKNLLIWFAGLLLVLLLMQSLALYWGLLPLNQLAAEVEQLELGEQSRLQQQYPLEISSVTRNLNRLIERQQTQQARYRNTLGDLAHSLKTPLAVIRAKISMSDSSEATKLLAQVDDMDDIIGYQLKRSVVGSVERHDQLGGQVISVDQLLQRIINALSTVYRDKNVQLSFNAEALTLVMDEADFMEVFGNILDNAFKFCGQTIIVTAKASTRGVSPQSSLEKGAVIVIEDDGSGIPDQQQKKVLERGVRLDATTSGQGIGLAIAQDIIDARGGAIHLGQSSLGGAKVEVEIPND